MNRFSGLHFFLLFLLGTANHRVFAQLGFTWTTYTNDPTVYITFDDITRRNKIEFDTLSCYCSPGYKVLITSNKKDSVTGLILGKTYYVRNIQIDASGSNIGTWKATTNYYVAGYAASDLMSMNSPVVENKSPYIYTDFQPGSKTRMELYYDTVPTFNTPAFINYSNDVYPNYSFPSFTHGKEFYLKAKTTFGNQVLPEKIIRVRNNYKPQLQVAGLQCSTSPAKVNLYLNHVYSSYPAYYKGKFYIQSGGKWDSMDITGNTTSRLVNVSDTNPLKYYSWQRVAMSKDTALILDSGVIANPLFSNPQAFQTGYYENHQAFVMFSYNCSTTYEFQVWKDSTFTNLIQSRTKLTTGSSGNDSVILKFDMYANNVIKYRYQRGGVWSGWKYYSRKNYTPQTYAYPQQYLNTPGPFSQLTHANVYKGKWVQAELDTVIHFTSGWKKTVLVRDSNPLFIPLYYQPLQYIRIRQTDGIWYSPWSRTFAQVNEAKTKSLAPDCRSTYPTISFNGTNTQWRRYFDIEYGASPTDLRYKLHDVDYTTDATPILAGGNIYARIRYRTIVDTMYWSDITTCTYTRNNYYCVNPYISWVGMRAGKDTLHVRYVDKDPAHTEGMLLLIGDKNKNVLGFKNLAPGSSLAVVQTKNLPPAGWITIISNCSNWNYIYPGSYKWFSYSNPSLGLGEIAQSPMYYRSEDYLLIFPSALERNIRVFEMSGKCVLSASTSEQEFSVQNLKSGVYLVAVSSAQGSTNCKILVP
ncbi:MAG: T9SS type A sorting domain-containing protein [Bacteroidetes bacterium]|nr:T9SS type A sorting domain-containing protein [Bacteroidota bacterium]